MEFNTYIAHEFYNDGIDNFSIGDYRGAIEDYSKAISLKPDFADAIRNRETAKRKLEQQEKGTDENQSDEE